MHTIWLTITAVRRWTSGRKSMCQMMPNIFNNNSFDLLLEDITKGATCRVCIWTLTAGQICVYVTFLMGACQEGVSVSWSLWCTKEKSLDSDVRHDFIHLDLFVRMLFSWFERKPCFNKKSTQVFVHETPGLEVIMWALHTCFTFKFSLLLLPFLFLTFLSSWCCCHLWLQLTSCVTTIMSGRLVITRLSLDLQVQIILLHTTKPLLHHQLCTQVNCLP